jgi:hypothetical protein
LLTQAVHISVMSPDLDALGQAILRRELPAKQATTSAAMRAVLLSALLSASMAEAAAGATTITVQAGKKLHEVRRRSCFILLLRRRCWLLGT